MTTRGRQGLAALVVVLVLAGVALLAWGGPSSDRGGIAAGSGTAPSSTSPAAPSTSAPSATTSPGTTSAPTASASASASADDPATTAPTAPASSASGGGPADPSSAPEEGAEGRTRITIGAAGVDGPLVPQGLSPEGVIDPGKGEVIWFTGADRVAPGEVGTAVVAAHVSWEGEPDAFARLPEVSVGDVVTLGHGDRQQTFTVTRTATVDKDRLSRSLAVWGPHPDRPRLAIITCDARLGFGGDGRTEANYVVIAEG